MSLKRRFKRWLHGQCPGFKGCLPYFGERLFFPPGSVLFDLACAQGIYEHENLRIMQAALRPHAWCFDIGANIGLMSAPLLAAEPTLQVVSVEASPDTASYLARSVAASPRRDRWRYVAKAVGATEGETVFFASDESHGAYDGLKNTGRGRAPREVEVSLTTLDTLWREFGQPDICLVKIDVEGGEADVLRGGATCLRTTRPYVLLEWNAQNLAAYGCPPEALPELAATLDYEVLGVHGLAPVTSSANLALQMKVNENFVLVPRA
ncbi:MAG TPA: FkbM family methyltransferase [Opitutaceae bacterium]|nr:FkbM family methyltransferase [Opitutaceae bacterium]